MNLQTKTFSKKVSDFSEILRSFACDFRDFGCIFLFVIFVIFWIKSRDFQEKSFGNTGWVILPKKSNSNGGDGNSEAVEEFLGEDWAKLAEFGWIWTSKIEMLFCLLELATF